MKNEEIRLLYILTKPETLRFLRGQVAYMKERGFQIQVITSPGQELTEFGESQGVSTASVEMTRKISPFRDLRSFFRVLSRIREFKPHLIHASTPKAALLGTIAARCVGVPIKVFLLRNLQLSTASRLKRPLVWGSYKLTVALADQVLAVSPSLRELTAKERLCPISQIKVLAGGSSNGVDAILRFNPELVSQERRDRLRQQFGLSDAEQVVGFIGRIATIKGVAELVDAWRSISTRHPSARLLMLGRFDDNHPLDQRVKESLQSDPRVLLAGQVPDPAPYYSIMDLVVLPSYREGLPNALLEAAAMERPIVTTNALGCVDAIEDGVTGKLVPLGNSAELASAIECYLDNGSMRLRHGLAGRRRVLERFQQQPVWEANYQEFLRLLRSKGIEPPPPLSRTPDCSTVSATGNRAESPESDPSGVLR
ncbi:N,N'-diacetylbacillosaminyl-diphospho-undecaprenol alpha-1,3-N-acetylgalactosaminyltransferase [Stieleria neptunia]|uniref:N, N'-diacetylbacillosaminyl-diphospho-undecaprenol alpha-1,3-N-acetylgalactosaminyltransferase n=1 Tax=Stieleria neptunia TaxID=2527979 RepID=A0A518HNE9_9BACT|nr:glycosyltransferase family 4 protein [Stieleria neptunia]QDV42297.1 N,N'-diacetylbacillosaminyl-diphospho-undecaprenol alpha-1,3-N-acetylgalactosaminyltransferase [Stieleria neptunia]